MEMLIRSASSQALGQVRPEGVKEIGKLNMVNLKNGTQELAMIVGLTMPALAELLEECPEVFDRLFRHCQDRNNQLSSVEVSKLIDFGIIVNGHSVSNSVCNIVVSAAADGESGMRLDSPIQS